MAMVFTKEEKDKMQDTLEKVVHDLRSIFEISQEDVLRHEFKTIENGKEYEYYLIIKAKEAFISHRYSDWYMQLDKKHGSTYRMHKIKDYNTAFEFIKKYEIIREAILLKAKQSAKKKKIGMDKIDAVNSKYTKEAIIEVEMPETVNQSSIEVTQEDGKNIGRINIGPVSIKILSSPSVRIVTPEVKKVKKR